MNICNNFIPHETKTFDCKRLKWMNSFTIIKTDYNKDLLNNQANECTRFIIQAKE